MPLPALEPAGQAALPWLLSVSAVQYLKPLPLSLMFLPRKTVMVSTVASVWLFLTNSLSVEFLGFFFLPALVGVSFAVTSGAAFCARATDATAIESTAASAAIRYLRKDSSSGECVRLGEGVTAPI